MGSSPSFSLHNSLENRIKVGTLAFASEYLSIIVIPGVKPLERACFLHRLLASITSFGMPAFWASAVTPLRNERPILNSFDMFTSWPKTLDQRFLTLSRRSIRLGLRSAVVARLKAPGSLPMTRNIGPETTFSKLSKTTERSSHPILILSLMVDRKPSHPLRV